MKWLSKFILGFVRQWHKTSRGTWHIVAQEFPLKSKFVPACMPHAVWMATASKKSAPPKGAVICKNCKKLMEAELR